MAVPAFRDQEALELHSATPRGIETLAAGAFLRYLRVVARRSALCVIDVEGRALDARAVQAALCERTPGGRPVIVVYWGADAVAVALLPFLSRAFLDATRSRRFLFDETFGGRVCAALIGQFGAQCAMLARAGHPQRLEQLVKVMRHGGALAFAVDGGGPYFRVGSGVGSLARTLKAIVVPVAAVPSRAVRWVHRSGISFPLPFGEIRAAIGRPVDGLHRNRREVASEIEASLHALAKVVRVRRQGGVPTESSP